MDGFDPKKKKAYSDREAPKSHHEAKSTSPFMKDKRARTTRPYGSPERGNVKVGEGSEKRPYSNPNRYQQKDDSRGGTKYGSDYRKKEENPGLYDDRSSEGRKSYTGNRPAGERKSYQGDRPAEYRPKTWGNDKPKAWSNDRPKKKSSFKTYNKDNYPKFSAPQEVGEVRLNKFIANSGTCSRREADELIASGAITVNGEVVTELGHKIMPGQQVRFNGELLSGEPKVYIVMNKPKGFVTTVEDPHADKTVTDLVKNICQERVYPVGRLDKNSLGVLLITNDGALTKKLTHPSHNKKKIYQVTLDRPLTKADMDQMVEGIELEDGPMAVDEIGYVGESRKEVGVEIHSGRNRIVRRMFDALGYKVVKLDRVYFAGLTKKRLKRGGWRFLSAEEVRRLKSGDYE